MTNKKSKHYFNTIPKKFNKKQRFAIMLIKKYPDIKAKIESGEAVEGRDQKLYDVISDTIFRTKFLPNGYDRLELIERKYWKKETNAKEYATEKFVSYSTAMLWLYDFINAVIANMEIV